MEGGTTQSSQQNGTSKMLNEWGKYTGNRDMIRIRNEGSAIQHIEANDPAIQSLSVSIERNSTIDWVVVGQHLGRNRHVKHMSLSLNAGHDDYNLLAFCKGLACNTSIVALEVKLFVDVSEELFGGLLPFFSGNNSLQSLDVEWKTGIDTFSTNLRVAVEASPSLKSVGVTTFESSWRDVKLERASEFNDTVFTKPGIEHVMFYHFMLSESACNTIRSVLADENCSLKSLELARVKAASDSDIVKVADGLKCNKSVKALKIDSTKDELMKPLLSTLEDGLLENLEQLELYSHFRGRAIPVAAAVRRMPNLKYLTLDGPRFERETWNEIFSAVLGPTMSLYELRIIRGLDNDESMQDLALFLATNATLKVLDLSGNVHVSAEGWNCLKSLKPPNLRELHLKEVIKSDSIMRSLSICLASNTKLKTLTFPKYDTDAISIEGWDALATVLERHTGIEEIRFDLPNSRSLGRENANQFLIVNALRENTSLKRVTIPICSTLQFTLLADYVKSPNCRLEELNVHYFQSPRDQQINRSVECIQLSQIAVDLLQRNTSLKTFRFQHCNFRLFEFDWSSMSRLLCDRSSIDATYNSKHTLECFEVVHDFNPTIPLGLYSMVYLNKNQNKRVVALDKIVHCHDLVSIDYISSTLPLVMSKVGESKTDKSLSQMYCLLCKNQHEIEKMC